MEKSEKRRFSMKPKLEPVEKAKNTRRNSKMIKTKTQENEIQQQQNQPAPPNTMIQNTVPIMQAQYYGMQPQMVPYGQPMMIGALPGQDISQNQYILNQINPGPPVAFVPLKFGYCPQEIVFTPLIPKMAGAKNLAPAIRLSMAGCNPIGDYSSSVISPVASSNTM